MWHQPDLVWSNLSGHAKVTPISWQPSQLEIIQLQTCQWNTPAWLQHGFPLGLLYFYTVLTHLWSELSASWHCNGWDTNCLNTCQSFNMARSFNKTIIFFIECIHYFKNQNNIHTAFWEWIEHFCHLKILRNSIVVVMHGWVCYWHVHDCSGVHGNPLAIFFWILSTNSSRIKWIRIFCLLN